MYPALQASSPRRVRGFSLVELMVVVAVVAILALVAMPAYTNYVIRGKLTEAFNQLGGLAMSLEQYYQDNRTYAGACGAAGLAQLPAPTVNYTYTCRLWR